MQPLQAPTLLLGLQPEGWWPFRPQRFESLAKANLRRGPQGDCWICWLGSVSLFEL
jgi:hypothetical protein